MRHRASATVVLLSMLTMLGSCDRDRASKVSVSAIVISGDTGGWIVPCGCTANQSGGLLRRGTLLRQLRAAGPTIYADVGGAGAGTSPYQAVKFEYILRGEKLMGVSAHNLGSNELAQGGARIQEIEKRLAIPFISANTQTHDGMPIVEPMRIETLGGKRIALVGVVSPKFATSEISVSDPVSAISAAIASQKGNYDALIVLAYLPEDELNHLAAALPEADAIIGGPTGQAVVPQKSGAVLVGASTNKGKFLVRLTPAADPHSWSGSIDELTAGISDDAEQVANLNAYLAELAQKDFPAADSGFAPTLPDNAPASYRIAGTQSCASCHAAEQKAWQNSPHALAWSVLVAKNFHVDSSCQQCHTTGFGLPGGFVSRSTTPTLVNVGCENCHGPSQAHLQDPHVHTTYAAFDQCIRCHDHENSPLFEKNSFWARIAHGHRADGSVPAPDQTPGGVH